MRNYATRSGGKIRGGEDLLSKEVSDKDSISEVVKTTMLTRHVRKKIAVRLSRAEIAKSFMGKRQMGIPKRMYEKLKQMGILSPADLGNYTVKTLKESV